MTRAAIIGAGMTGLTAAHFLLEQGLDIRVFDKGRARGGRIATRKTPFGLFDHGAPQFDVADADFDHFLLALGTELGAPGVRFGCPGMRSVFDRFEGDGRFCQSTCITSIKREPDGWVLGESPERSFGHFDHLLLTVPAPQAYDLVQDVDPDLAEQLLNVRMNPVWTCMALFESALPDIAVSGLASILRADKMGRKPGRCDPREAWVIHMKPAFAEGNLNADPEMIAPVLLELFAEQAGIELPQVQYLAAHRWRYAFAENPLGAPFLQSSVPGLLVGGDWALGSKAEDGFQSGRAMARTILSQVAAPV